MLLSVRFNDQRFETLQAIKDADGQVGTLEDSAASRYLEDQGIRCKTYTDQLGPYNDLAAGKLDAVLFDSPIALYYGQKSMVTRDNPLFQKAQPPFRFIDNLPTYAYYAIAVQKENEELAEQINAALGRLLEDGTLQFIYEKWGMWDEHQEKLLAEYGGAMTRAGNPSRRTMRHAGVQSTRPTSWTCCWRGPG